MKMSKFKKRALVVVSTLIGVIALFLVVVFIPIGNDANRTVTKNDTVVVETEDTETDGMSKKELEKKVKELEEENKELKDEVEKYKILAEQTTQSISAPVVKITDDDKDSKDKKSSDDKEYKDSSEYYDKNYKDYTNDDDDNNKDKSDSSSSQDKTPSKNNSSSDSNLSDTGL